VSADSADDPIAAARRAGVEADEHEARQWMLAVAADDPEAVSVDRGSGVFGDHVALLDFDPQDLTRFLRLVPHARLSPHPDVETAIAIAGSAAQGRVQLFPGDADFFERLHVRAADADGAAKIVRAVMRATARRAFAERDVVLVEVNLGTYPEAVIERGKPCAAGDSITWTPADVEAGRIVVGTPRGTDLAIDWNDVGLEGGWVYLGWIVAERDEGRIALVSNMVDATWEDAGGVIRSLDGAIDPLSQEVYLEPAAMDLVVRLEQQVPGDARDSYRAAMRAEVLHYTRAEPNFAKAAKRLYNLFRVSDQLEAAAYVRELFDEPAARLYQVPGLLEAADLALDPASGIDRETVLRQLDLVADAIAAVTDGGPEAVLLAAVRRLRDDVAADGDADASWDMVLADVRKQCAVIVSEFFRARLLAYARIRDFIESLDATGELGR
jgi:hypothetical protein